jgi:UrcA family protein
MIKIASRPIGAVVLSGVAGLVLSMSTPVLAEQTASVTKISIDTHDIDLSSPAGIEKLHQRVNSAIRSACAPVEFGAPTSFGMGEVARAESDCLAGARASAAPKVQKLIANGNPKVAAY